MKFTVTFKDTDVLQDAARDAVMDAMPESLDEDEKELLVDSRTEKLTDFAGTWIKYGEYVTIEFDTEAKTAIVVPNS